MAVKMRRKQVGRAIGRYAVLQHPAAVAVNYGDLQALIGVFARQYLV
jgi:hypothetical protein